MGHGGDTVGTLKDLSPNRGVQWYTPKIAVFLTSLLPPLFLSRKKKKNKGLAVGIYNGNVNTQLPMQPKKLQKVRKDSESHVYADIDDTIVYGHLLLDSNGSFVQPEVDTYRPFQGSRGDCPPSPPPTHSRVPTAKLTTEEPPPGSSAESESEPYTFSHPNKGNESNRDTDIPLLDAHEPAESVE